MSRPIGSKNKEQTIPELIMSEEERLDRIALLIIELLEEESAEKEVGLCSH